MTTGLPDHKTTRPQDHKTTGLRDQTAEEEGKGAGQEGDCFAQFAGFRFDGLDQAVETGKGGLDVTLQSRAIGCIQVSKPLREMNEVLRLTREPRAMYRK